MIHSSDHITVVTHDGVFHADDVLAVATLKLALPEVRVIRTRDPEIMKTADILVDIGGVYDPDNNRFDHHQSDRPIRENGIPYSSFGLVWKKYGVAAINFVLDTEHAEEIANTLTEEFIEIDMIDNGIMPDGGPKLGISQVVTSSNPYDAPLIDVFDSTFEHMVEFCVCWLTNQFRRHSRIITDRDTANKMIASDEEIFFLGQHNSAWKSMAIEHGCSAKLVVFASLFDPGFIIQAVPPKGGDSFSMKVGAPQEWRGRSDFDVDGVNVEFCHANGFLAKTRGSAEDALSVAKRWIENGVDY